MCAASLPAARCWLVVGLALGLVRTAAAAGGGSAGCVEHTAVNAHGGDERMLIVAGGCGAGPALIAYDPKTGASSRLGPLFEAGSPYASASGRGWYFSARRPTTLYVTDAAGTRLERYDVLAKTLETVLDTSLAIGAGRRVSGAHSSDDDTVHSAIVSDEESGASVGCLVYREDVKQSVLHPAQGALAQCRVDGSGRRLLIEGAAAEDNRVVDLETGAETPLSLTPEDAPPDPTLLPVATIAQIPLTAAYSLLQVPSRAAGSVYLDPTTGVKVYKLTSATFPAASARWGHDYAEGGDEVSLPYNGPTRAVLVRQNGGAWWLIDFTPGVGVSNPRPLAGPLAPLMDLAFTFSNNPATPYYAYVSNGATIRRFDIRTMAEAPGSGWPVTGESSAMWLHQSENDGLFVWMRGANGSTVVGYEPATGTRKTYTNANLNEPRIDRAGRYVGLSMNTPLNGLVVWDWQANAVAWTSPGDPGIPFAHNASLRRRWMTVDWNMSYPPDFALFRPDVPNSGVHVGGPANGTTIHGNGSWNQHPANLDDQWALFCHYGSLRPTESYWLAPGAMVLVTPAGQRRILGHPYNTTGNYTFFTFAKFSSDGRYVLFTSDMNGSARSDVFLAEVPQPPSAPGTDLIVHLKLDEGRGMVANDASGTRHQGRLINGASWGAGRSGQAVVLDGVDGLVRVSHAPVLNAYPLTVAAWFKTTTATGVEGLVNKYAGSSYNGYQMFFNNGSLCAWYLRDTSNFVYDGGGCTLATPGYNDGAWHQAVFVVDAAGGRLYVDGVQKASRGWTGTAGPPTTLRGISVGFSPGAAGGGGYLAGSVDGVRVYRRALGPGEVQQLYAGEP